VSRALVHQRDVGHVRVSWFDRVLIGIAPDWGLRRVRARATAQLVARHFEAAQGSRRTTNWNRSASDANVANQPALSKLREISRDLRRNNGWAKRGIQAIVNSTVGWGITAKPTGPRGRATQALAVWNEWANSTACDYDGRLNFYGIQRLAMETIAESGEVLIMREPASTADGLPIPMRIRVLEPDYLDLSRNGFLGPDGGPTYNGVEFDKFGRRTAYWLFTQHPGGLRVMTSQMYSVRVPADRILHVYRVDRPGQIRGVPWLASAITKLKDFDDFEDAELMQAKVAACFAAFVTDIDGSAGPLTEGGVDNNGDPIDQLEPGHIAYLTPGKDVKFAAPPPSRDSAFSIRKLRHIAVSMGITYEQISGDYSQVNYSSARMARLELKANVNEWREHMLLPVLCDGIWNWAMELVSGYEGWTAAPGATWSCPPMSILEPDKEALAYTRMIRAGLMTWPQVILELGYDPRDQLTEIEEYNKLFDAAGVVLDGDPRKMTQAGQVQALPAAPEAADAATADDGDAEDDDAADDASAKPATH
jgi:lambda family phage portal protein